MFFCFLKLFIELSFCLSQGLTEVFGPNRIVLSLFIERIDGSENKNDLPLSAFSNRPTMRYSLAFTLHKGVVEPVL